MKTQNNLVLASGSPRRRELLILLGLDYQLKTTEVSEEQEPGESPNQMVRRLSVAKTLAAVTDESSVIIGADTTVAHGDHVLGKPADSAAAIEMLRLLRSRMHSVYTGVSILDTSAGAINIDVAETQVRMRDYSDTEINEYVASGDPLDKAGSYAVQHSYFNPVERFEGCYTNIVGLPLCHVYRVLVALEITVPVHPLACCPWAVQNGCQWAKPILQLPVTFSSIVTKTA